MLIREIEYQDLYPLLKLYTYLHDNTMPTVSNEIEVCWSNIIKDPNHHIIVGVENHIIISSCVLIIIPNLTNYQRSYALIENVITHPEYRNRGCGSKILNYAKRISVDHKCYKIMLMTGSKNKSTLNFYQHAGYNMDDKTAFIQWLTNECYFSREQSIRDGHISGLVA